ncbi:MAG: hypothetical protein WBZ42_10885 [Halobacteriota archaeon]
MKNHSEQDESQERIIVANYSDVAQNWSIWAHQARKLKRAAEIILVQVRKDIETGLPDPEERETFLELLLPLDAVYLSLIGMALENLLKGICVLNDPSLIDSERGEVKLKTHDVHSLATERLNLKLNEEESKFLEKLERYVTWEGKYPVPLKHTDYALKFPCYGDDTQGYKMISVPFEDCNYLLGPTPDFDLEKDPAMFNELFERIISIQKTSQ